MRENARNRELIGRRSAVGTSGPAPADALAEQRIEAARRCHAWVELDDELVERGHGYFVDAASDAVYLRYRGDAFTRAGQVLSDQAPLYFTVKDDVLVLEKQPESWSQLIYRRERARAR
jgi:hypothetical protein